MVKTKNVLVLGAGASKHCGYPLGQQLYDFIIENLGHVESLDLSKLERVEDFNRYRSDVQIILAGNYDQKELIAFREALKFADRTSIDKFLERRSDLIQIGKLCIAQTLIPYEKHNIRGQQNWYQALFNVLDGNLADFSNNKLSIITFNYDRSLEHYLFHALKSAHGIKDDKEVAALINNIPIVHVHGQLGMLPWQSPDISSREYGGILTQGKLIKASESIKIIHEDITNDPELNRAKQLIKESERVYFLGFGYDPTNIRRLGINEVGHNNFMGTGLGLTSNAFSIAREEFGRMRKIITINREQNIVSFFETMRF